MPESAYLTVWLADPPDGVVCLISTRRVLDENGHCCDYERCTATIQHGKRVDRCLYNPGHEGAHHARFRSWDGPA